jgi:hypothetical protein
VVVQRSSYGDWSAQAWRSGCARCLAQAALTGADGLRVATALRQRPGATGPEATFEQFTQLST